MIRIGTPPQLPRAGGLRLTRRLASYMFCVSSVLGVYSIAITSVGRCSGDFRLRRAILASILEPLAGQGVLSNLLTPPLNWPTLGPVWRVGAFDCWYGGVLRIASALLVN